MRIDKFGIGAFIIGLAIVIGMLNFYFGWQLIPAVTTLVTGGVTLLGLVLIVIGMLLMVL
jgi:CHASE2 domain-containing sensor protein